MPNPESVYRMIVLTECEIVGYKYFFLIWCIRQVLSIKEIMFKYINQAHYLCFIKSILLLLFYFHYFLSSRSSNFFHKHINVS